MAGGWLNSIHLHQGSECTDQWEESRAFFHCSGADLHGHVLEFLDLKEVGSSRGEALKKFDGLVASSNGLGIIGLSSLIGLSFSADHLLVVGHSSLKGLSLSHIFFNLTIKVI